MNTNNKSTTMKTTKLTDGIHTDITIDDYHADTRYLSATALKHFMLSPNHYEYWLATKDDEPKKTHFEFGNAFEIMLIQPDTFDDRVYVMDNTDIIATIGGKRPTATNAYKTWLDEQHAIASDRYIIPRHGPESMDVLERLIANCQADKLITALTTNVNYQHTCAWTEHGVQLKTRPDVCQINQNVIVEIKTTRNAQPDVFSRDVTKLEYIMSAAFQIRGVLETKLMPSVDGYYFLVAEKEPPHNVQLYRLTDDDIGMANAVLEHYIRTFAKYKSGALRPGYNFMSDDKHGVLDVTIPPYYWTKKGW